MSPQPQISSTDRIRDLSAISSEVPSLLTSAGAALQALTGQPLALSAASPSSQAAIDEADEKDLPASSIDASKAAFTQHTEAYFTILQSLMARLRRQAYALEEADIIAAEAIAQPQTQQQQQTGPATNGAAPGRVNMNQGAGVRRGPTTAAAKTEEGERITHGGLGNLDVAWLNSRVSRGGFQKEAEVLAEAKRLLELAAQEDTEMKEA